MTVPRLRSEFQRRPRRRWSSPGDVDRDAADDAEQARRRSVADPDRWMRGEIDLATLQPEQDIRLHRRRPADPTVGWQLSPIAPAAAGAGHRPHRRRGAEPVEGARPARRHRLPAQARAGRRRLSALFIGVNEYRRQRHLEDCARGQRAPPPRPPLRHQGDGRTHGAERGVDDDEAYELLRRESMRARQTLEDSAKTSIRDAAE